MDAPTVSACTLYVNVMTATAVRIGLAMGVIYEQDFEVD
ncbi:minor structural protein [Salmonella phage 19]|nr:minor structural protein [Salmonella phage 19]